MDRLKLLFWDGTGLVMAYKRLEDATFTWPAIRGGMIALTLAHVLVSKYADHLPLYRQSQILARAGLDLHRAVLADWVGKAAFHPKPVVDRLAEHLKRSSKLFMEFAGDRRPSGAA